MNKRNVEVVAGVEMNVVLTRVFYEPNLQRLNLGLTTVINWYVFFNDCCLVGLFILFLFIEIESKRIYFVD